MMSWVTPPTLATVGANRSGAASSSPSVIVTGWGASAGAYSAGVDSSSPRVSVFLGVSVGW